MPRNTISGPAIDGDPNNILLLKIWYALAVLSGGGTSGPGSGVAAPKRTYTAFHVANSGSTTIPTTAKAWAVNFIGTGTANTFGGNTAVTGGQGFSDNGQPGTAITIACDGSTVADGFYSTT